MQKKFLISAVVVLVAVVALVFAWQTKQSGEILSPVSVVQPDTTQEERYPQHIEVIQGSDEVWYNIPEYGVRMRLNREFAEDLIYKFVHEKNSSGEEWDSVYLSTKSIVMVAPECSPEENGALGIFSKYNGTVEEADKNGVGMIENYYSSRLKIGTVIQLTDFFIMWTGPQAPCWFPKNDAAVKESASEHYMNTGAKNVFDGMKTLSLIPSN